MAEHSLAIALLEAIHKVVTEFEVVHTFMVNLKLVVASLVAASLAVHIAIKEQHILVIHITYHILMAAVHIIIKVSRADLQIKLAISTVAFILITMDKSFKYWL